MEKDKNLIELLAKHEHDRWVKWQEYMFSCCQKNDDGSFVIPKDKVERWQRQIKTDYDNLSEKEKNSDRNQAKEIVDIIRNFHFLCTDVLKTDL